MHSATDLARERAGKAFIARLYTYPGAGDRQRMRFFQELLGYMNISGKRFLPFLVVIFGT